MPATQLKVTYQLELVPDEYKLILKLLDGAELTEDEDETATRLAIKLRQQRQATARQFLDSVSPPDERR